MEKICKALKPGESVVITGNGAQVRVDDYHRTAASCSETDVMIAVSQVRELLAESRHASKK